VGPELKTRVRGCGIEFSIDGGVRCCEKGCTTELEPKWITPSNRSIARKVTMNTHFEIMEVVETLAPVICSAKASLLMVLHLGLDIAQSDYCEDFFKDLEACECTVNSQLCYPRRNLRFFGYGAVQNSCNQASRGHCKFRQIICESCLKTYVSKQERRYHHTLYRFVFRY
jgi:hypothetical protein